MSRFRRDGCRSCGAVYEPRTVEVRREDVVLHDVQQGACPECGSRVYLRPTLERIESIMWSQGTDPVMDRVRSMSPFAAG
jgi:hypothetical protein